MATYIYRLYNTTSGDHFYTASAAERDWIIQNLAHFKYEGIAWTQDTTPDRPVYRFYEFGTDSHFFTASVDERNFLQGIPAGFSFEGTAFQASSFADAGAPQPVYRFYNPSDGLHFFTASDEERDFVLTVVKSYRLENVAFYVAPPPPKNPVGTSGNDTLELVYSAPRFGETAHGLAGNDTLYGGSGDDLMYGDDGDDRLTAGAGSDTLYGGSGGDVLDGGSGADLMVGDAGNDTLYGESGDTLMGGDGDDVYFGPADMTIIDNSGTSRRNLTSGGVQIDMPAAGADVLSIDRLYFLSNVPRFTINGSAGDNTVYAYGYDHIGGIPLTTEVHGRAGNDLLVVGALQSTLVYGDDGDDQLISVVNRFESGGGSSTSSDSQYGGNGNDTLIASDGNDYMSGGAGADLFYFHRSQGGGPVATYYGGGFGTSIQGTTQIADFEPGVDRIRMVGFSLTAQQIAAAFNDFSNIDGVSGSRAVFPGLGTGTSIVIVGQSASAVSADWFVTS